jgi:hypothetical protein
MIAKPFVFKKFPEKNFHCLRLHMARLFLSLIILIIGFGAFPDMGYFWVVLALVPFIPPLIFFGVLIVLLAILVVI